jgi:Toprim domain-containing protein
MTITSQTTQRGKVIHLVSFSDLVDAVQSGERLRASCPIHGSDHQRSLSIDLGTGWGFCHSCHATVLVQPYAPIIASNQGNRYGQHNAQSGFGERASAAQLHVPSVRPYLLRRVHTTTPLPQWQQEEVAALRAVAPLMRAALASSRRAQLYLTERGIPATLALASGVGYLSCAAWEQAPVSTEQQRLLKRWIGRIIFPLGSPDGQGFIGRTLLQWEPGMDENAHKALLDQPGAPRRWIKTNPAGWFGFDAPLQLAERVVLVEGGFDRLVLLAAGLPATAVIALVGTAARPAWLVRSAPQVKRVVLALDADDGGAVAMERLAEEFRRAGFIVTLCAPPQDQWGKDWGERWRRLGPQSIWPLYEVCTQHHTSKNERKER